ncbi:MAG: tail fiber assembly protein [Rouxiella aceris]|uniref:tail fiber assembly protein n=1 Tax=Rouxiella aceris TaxID=2703884 RepID=UPI0028511984|nr:tail fiber assembly protein [Rouxiella aceris]MDR3434640.1 tail fiber assembly protein [Rouxiella aceris]
MMRFSETTQAFYDDAYEKNALVNDIPQDISDVSDEQYRAFYTAINDARRVYAADGNFTLSAPRPDNFHTWDNSQKQWVLNDEGVVQQNAEEVASAINMKSLLLSSAQTVISEWQSELLLGVISDEDKTRLIAWLAYIRELKAVDTSRGASTTFPELPRP